jgi:hypothetical protein
MPNAKTTNTMRQLLLGLTVFFNLTIVQGQISFQKFYGNSSANEWGYSAHQTNDGGYILLGNNDGPGGIILYKVNSFGDTVWTNNFSGIACYSVRQTTDNGYILFGFKFIKTNSSGQLLWSKDVADIFGNYSAGYCVQQTTDGGYILSGEKMLNFGDLAIAKTTRTGDTVWVKTFGGSGQDRGNFVRQTTDGGYISTGFYFDNVSSWDIFLVKTDSNGNELWSKKFGGSKNDVGYCVQQTTDGGYIIVGETNSLGNGKKDLYLIKTTSTGDTVWTKTFGGINDDYGRYVYQTNDGGFIITGGTESFVQGSNYYPDVYLIKTDANGNLSWHKTFGISNYGDGGSYVQQTTDGGFVVFGGGKHPTDMFLIKTDFNGISGIDDISQINNQIIYPNPFTTQTTLETEEFLRNATLTVDNVFGRTVKEINNISGRKVILQRDNLPSGLYLFRLTQDNKILTTKKVEITD